MPDQLNCDAVDMQDSVSQYVSGRFTDEQAAAFEQHLEGCERCWAEVQVALQVRAATRSSEAPSREQSGGPRLRGPLWLVAAAASVALAIAGWWTLDSPHRPVEVTRGGSAIAITASRLPDGAVRVSWPVVDGASRYRLVVSRIDGVTLLARDTDGVELLLTPTDLPTPLPATVLVELRAEDALGTTLVAHGPVSVPISADRR